MRSLRYTYGSGTADVIQADDEMWIRRRDVEMAERCGEVEFSLYGRKGGKLVEEVANFKYLWQPMDQMDDDWTAV